MISPENTHFSNTELQDRILVDADAINNYLRPRQGEYARLRARRMLGEMVTKFSHIPIFVNGSPMIVPTTEGAGLSIGEITGKIAGFTYGDLGPEIDAWQPHTEGVVMQVSVPLLSEGDAPDAPWRLNALPEPMRDPSIEGFIVGVPATKSQKILQLGPQQVPLTVASIANAERPKEEYSYLDYVGRIRDLTGNKPSLKPAVDMARIKAFNILIQNMAFECPYLGELVAVESDYIRSPKPSGDGFNVVYGQISGVLRKFVHDIYQDYQTKEWFGDVMAVVYHPDIAALVVVDKLSSDEADKLASTRYIPLSRPHILATSNGIQS